MDYQSETRTILFNGPMVQAILEGRKTQTRRVVKPQPPQGRVMVIGGHKLDVCMDDQLEKFPGPYEWVRWLCPYGKAGDRLLVREAWRIASLPYDDAPGIQYRADRAEEWHDPIDYGWDEIKYEAWFERMTAQLIEDCEKAGLEPDGDGVYHWDIETNPNRWRPSIFLPRWASRITLEVTGVRVERVQDISEEDALAEGVGPYCELWESRPYHTFRFLWDSINAKRDYGWDVNPWVWVVEFQAQ